MGGGGGGSVTVIYENDLLFSAHKLAVEDMNRWYEGHKVDIDTLPYARQTELWTSLYNRAFLPKAVCRISIRLKARGHEIVRGDNPTERLTNRRHRERFLVGLTYTIDQAIERAATWH